MEANNNLRYDALNSIKQMEKGLLNVNGTLLVFAKTDRKIGYLLKIKYNIDDSKIVSDTITTFYSDKPSSSTQVRDVIRFSQENFPADSYGLVLWSHGTAWSPPSEGSIRNLSFGYDDGKEMDIIELAEVLPNNFDFILFDACNMASLEILYEFKDKAKYIIASPSETIAESFPYQYITTDLFRKLEDLKTVPEKYYSYYNKYSGIQQSACVSLVKTNQLDLLSTEVKNLIDLKAIGDTIVKANIQRMDFTTNFPVPLYDFEDFLYKNFDSKSLEDINKQLKLTVLYKANTTSFLGKPINNFCGVTCSLLEPNSKYLNYYKKLKWYNASGFDKLF